MNYGRSVKYLVIAAAVITTVFPVAEYWVFIGNAPTVWPAEARAALSAPGANAALVDVSEPAEFEALHIDGAINWPYSEISSDSGLPRDLQGRKLYMLCESGLMSALATKRIRSESGAEAYNVRGGMMDWYAPEGGSCPLKLCKLRAAGDRELELPFRESSLFDQWVMSIMAFGVKPLYMIISLVLIVVLWRSRDTDLVSLRWGMILFLAGEAFCAVNFIVFNEDSYLSEHLHNAGMVLGFGFVAFAGMEGLDHRMVRYSDPKRPCAALSLCGECVKHGEVPCGARRLLLFVVPAAMALAAVPLVADFHAVSYNTYVLGVLYNYSHPVLYQIYEFQVVPWTALVFLAGALTALLLNKSHPIKLAKVLFAGGLGFLGFSFFRLVFFGVFRDDLVWYQSWEELTELIFILGIGAVLWIFRARLFRERSE